MASVFYTIADLVVTPGSVKPGGGVRIDFKIKNAAGTLATPAQSVQHRVVDERGTELLAYTNSTASSTGIYYGLIMTTVIKTSVPPGRLRVQVRAREATGPPAEDYFGETSFQVLR